MSTHYHSWTFPVQAASIPAEPWSFDELAPLIERPEAEERRVRSCSRGNWIVSALRYLAAQANAPSLSFLWGEPTVLPHGALPPIGQGLEQAIEYSQRAPDEVAGRLAKGRDGAHILECIAQARFAEEPAGNEEGDDCWYLFTYLVSLQEVFTFANRNNLNVVHLPFATM